MLITLMKRGDKYKLRGNGMDDQLYLINERAGYGQDMARLVSMMDYARHTTIQEVECLTIEQLDYRFNDQANSIGMLLAHMAAVEEVYQILTIDKRDVTEEDEQKLHPALLLGPEGADIKGNSADWYLERLYTVRKQTMQAFSELDDGWLYEETEWWDGLPANNYFKWFHVFEDEINHRGQIRLIKKMLKRAPF